MVANVGQKMLEQERATEEQRRKDIRGVAKLMIEIMEPETSLQGSVVLQHPERWSDSPDIKGFLSLAAAATSAEELKRVSTRRPERTNY